MSQEQHPYNLKQNVATVVVVLAGGSWDMTIRGDLEVEGMIRAW